MKRIICLLLVLCCMACSMNLTAFASKTIKCPECNKNIPEDSAFCSYCGTKLTSGEETTSRSFDWREANYWNTLGDFLKPYGEPSTIAWIMGSGGYLPEIKGFFILSSI